MINYPGGAILHVFYYCYLCIEYDKSPINTGSSLSYDRNNGMDPQGINVGRLKI